MHEIIDKVQLLDYCMYPRRARDRIKIGVCGIYYVRVCVV